MKLLFMFVASAVSASLVLPTVSQAQVSCVAGPTIAGLASNADQRPA